MQRQEDQFRQGPCRGGKADAKRTMPQRIAFNEMLETNQPWVLGLAHGSRRRCFFSGQPLHDSFGMLAGSRRSALIRSGGLNVRMGVACSSGGAIGHQGTLMESS